jgi:hypothetical protein
MFIVTYTEHFVTSDTFWRAVNLLIGLALGYFIGATRTANRMCREMANEVHHIHVVIEELERGHDDDSNER